MVLLGGALVISAALAVIIGCHFWTKFSPVLLFWAAFILTRPLGATVGDLLTKTHEKGGLGFGTIGSSAVLFGILAVLVAMANRAAKCRIELAG